jgi:hypothetical protein
MWKYMPFPSSYGKFTGQRSHSRLESKVEQLKSTVIMCSMFLDNKDFKPNSVIETCWKNPQIFED